MQRDRDDRDIRDRERDQAHFRPPLHRSGSSSSSFLHGLPPPHTHSPQVGYYPPSPPVTRDMPSTVSTPRPDHRGWSHASTSPSAMDMARPGSSRRGWSPPPHLSHSPRFTERLPSLSDYPQPPPAHYSHAPRHWEAPPPPNPLHPAVKTEPFHHQSPMREHEPYASPRIHQGHEQLPPPPPLPPHHSYPPLESPGGMARSPRAAVSARPQTAPVTARSTSKHHAPSPQEAAPEQPKKKKRRQAFSCAECAKRKQKCNRETPCQHCVSRKVPHLCVPSARSGSPPPRPKPKAEGESTTARSKTQEPSSGSLGPAQTVLTSRVTKLERIVNAVLNRVEGLDGSSALTEWRQSYQPATSPPSVHAKLDLLLPSATSPAPSTTQGRIEPESGEDAWLGGLDRGTVGRNPLPQSQLRAPLGLNHQGSVREQLDNIIGEGGATTLRHTLQDLPEKDRADKLVDFFFAKVNDIRYPIDERLFRQAYEVVYASGDSITAESVLALPVIFAVLAIAVRLHPDGPEGASEETRRRTSMKLFWAAQFGVMVSLALNAENLKLVEARILIGLYLVLMHERRLAEGWLQFRAAIATGTAICLHRDGSRLGLDAYMVEYRRRLWSYLCHADATYSCLLGRPTSINPDFYDTKEPSNIELASLVDVETAPPSKPLEDPTFATFLILRKRLADIVAKLVYHFQKLHTTMRYSDVQTIHEQLQKLRDDLPPHFRMLKPDKSLDKERPILPIHRYYIQTEILHFTIILHRPWFLRQVLSDKYSLSRRACFEAAISDFNIRQEFHEENQDFFETLLGGSFREFNTAMIAGINILLEPNSLYASEMWNIVTKFMEHHPYSPRSDEYSRKEAAIIHTLHRRASALRGSSPEEKARPGAHPLQDNTSFERGGRTSSGNTVESAKTNGETSGTGSSHSSRAASSSMASVLETPAAAGPQTPRFELGSGDTTDQVQDLFNHFLTRNSEFGLDVRGKPKELDSSLPSNKSLLGLLGITLPVVSAVAAAVEKNEEKSVKAEVTVELEERHFATDSSLAFAAVPWSLYSLRALGEQHDVNSSQYWDAFADVVVEQAGHY